MRVRVRAINPDLYLVGEIWDDASDWVDDGTRFDGVMNYPVTEAMIRFAAQGRLDEEVIEPVNLTLEPALDAAGLPGGHRRAPPAPSLGGPPGEPQPAGLPRHRPDPQHGGRGRRRGPSGRRPAADLPGHAVDLLRRRDRHDGRHDPGCRAGFPWDRPETWNTGLLEAYRSPDPLRHAEPALRQGAYRSVAADEGLYVFARETDEGGVLVAVNAGDADTSVEIDEEVGDCVGIGTADE